ncbi:hypothetical protein EVAR_23033_1 [Eumeta japonica]|uniref:Uncharacterized protein n=1 Tax=Eumeta variegata TaxID=151549 RepID=A0A4C1UQ50_EUMVA|nr:hypothetical protein EVAR_23033_1 [Eumeta japonica]
MTTRGIRHAPPPARTARPPSRQLKRYGPSLKDAKIICGRFLAAANWRAFVLFVSQKIEIGGRPQYLGQQIAQINVRMKHENMGVIEKYSYKDESGKVLAISTSSGSALFHHSGDLLLPRWENGVWWVAGVDHRPLFRWGKRFIAADKTYKFLIGSTTASQSTG